MIQVIMFIVICFFTACGYRVPNDQCIGGGTKCHGEDSDSGRVSAEQGLPGKDGTSCTTSQIGNDAEIRCTDGTVTRVTAGTRGDTGETGPVGPQGNPGTDGSSCSVQQVLQGAVVSCTNGTSVLVLNGTDGNDGSDGQDGAPGTAGTIVLPVRLCPGVSTYPSKFVEEAFCIQNKLYAVYSTNGGFLTEIPPGQYSSNAVGSSCNFTVLNNCQIQ